jgi:hypothetical protein
MRKQSFIVRASGGAGTVPFYLKIATYSGMSADGYTQGEFSPVFLFLCSYQHGVWTLTEYR